MSKDEKVVQRIEEDAPFDVQPFDEKEFIRKELISFRTTVVLFIFSILVAGITFFVWKASPGLRFPILVLIALGLGAALLRFIFKMVKIDIGHWKRREWLGTLFLYFFFWLGFFLLLVNPPFTDAAAPKVEVAAVPPAQAPGGDVTLGAYVADDTGLAGSPTFCIRPYEGTQAPPYTNLSESDRAACATTWERQGDRPFWRHNDTYAAGHYAAYVVAEDKHGHLAESMHTFEVSSPFVAVNPPRDNKFAGPEDALNVRLRPEIMARTVQFSFDGGENWHDFVPHVDPALRAENYWRTQPVYEGWETGTHNVSLRVLLQPVYLRAQENVLRGVANDTQTYTLTVDPGLTDVGTRHIDYGRGLDGYREFPYANSARTPGLGVPLLLVAVALLVVARRRRAD